MDCIQICEPAVEGLHDQGPVVDGDVDTTTTAPRGPAAQRRQTAHAAFPCDFPGCTRTFSELWKLRKHYRSPSQPGCGARGHDCELRECPRCKAALDPNTAHVGCKGGLAAPQQAAKRRRYREAHESYKLRRCASSSPSAQASSPVATPVRCSSEAVTALPAVHDLLDLLPQLRNRHPRCSPAAPPADSTLASDSGASVCTSPFDTGPSDLQPLHAAQPSVRQEAAAIVDHLVDGLHESALQGLLPPCGRISAANVLAHSSMPIPAEAAGAYPQAFEQQPLPALQFARGSDAFGQQLSWQPSVCSSTGFDIGMLSFAVGSQDDAMARPANAQQAVPSLQPPDTLRCSFTPFGPMYSGPPLTGSQGATMTPLPPPQLWHHQPVLPPRQGHAGYFGMCPPQPDPAAIAEDPLMFGGVPPQAWGYDQHLTGPQLD